MPQGHEHRGVSEEQRGRWWVIALPPPRPRPITGLETQSLGDKGEGFGASMEQIEGPTLIKGQALLLFRVVGL